MALTFGSWIISLAPSSIKSLHIVIDADSLAVYGATGGVGGTGNGLLKNDSAHDLVDTDLNAGGRMKYNVMPHDCAIPADVTIDFNATLERCTTDNCTGDSYHVEPSWD